MVTTDKILIIYMPFCCESLKFHEFLFCFIKIFFWGQVITGYLLAGSIIGPGGLNFVSEMVQVRCFYYYLLFIAVGSVACLFT